MKKVFWIISLLFYVFTSSSIVHGSMMGIFDHNEIWTISSCKNDHTSEKTKNNIDCCKLIYVDQYSQCEIKSKDQLKIPSIDLSIIIAYTDKYSTIIDSHQSYSNLDLWEPPNIRYQNFSDLVWIIVKSI